MASEKVIGIESSAVSVLKRAVEYDTQSRLTSALVCYQEGIQLLLDVIKSKSKLERVHFLDSSFCNRNVLNVYPISIQYFLLLPLSCCN